MKTIGDEISLLANITIYLSKEEGLRAGRSLDALVQERVDSFVVVNSVSFKGGLTRRDMF